MFRRILDHPLIEVQVDTDYAAVKGEVEYDHLVYTGPIDKFFGYRFGALPYRSLEFDLRNEPTPDGRLPVAGHLCQRAERGRALHPHHRVPPDDRTGASPLLNRGRRVPAGRGRALLPDPARRHRALYRRYEALADALPGTTFVGRLARYQYLNMDQVVGQALSTANKLIATRSPVEAGRRTA